MREILFRGKSVDSGEWIEGGIFKYHNVLGYERFLILEETESGFRYTQVNNATVCQYTGLTDKNGVKIWENDVVFVTDDNGCSGQVDTGIGEIDFLEGLWYISGSVQNSLYDIDKCFQIEVIGNIFDNPELMKGGTE